MALSWQERRAQADLEEKRCSRCGQILPLDAFVANERMWLGRSSWCRECHRQAVRDWRARNRNELNARRREQYRRENPLPEGRRCVECGCGIPASRKAGALVCSPECRQARKRAQRAVSKRPNSPPSRLDERELADLRPLLEPNGPTSAGARPARARAELSESSRLGRTA